MAIFNSKMLVYQRVTMYVEKHGFDFPFFMEVLPA